MSKWVNKNLFEEFVEQKTTEAMKDESKPSSNYRKWNTPEAGTADKAKTYELRFLPDKEGNPKYRKIYYHMFKAGEKWSFSLCPKTHDFENYCPICAVSGKLYTGSEADKKLAKSLKRKEKFVQNVYIVDDPRDAEISDDALKSVGKVMLYEFPSKVESKLKAQLADKKRGLGPAIFDPSDEGFNFILNVKSTKPGPDGKAWPDYADSEFDRRPSAIADDEQGITAIIEQTYNLDDYLKTLEKTESEIVELLQSEMIFSLIEDEYNRKHKKDAVKESAQPEVKEEVKEEVQEPTTSKKASKPAKEEVKEESKDDADFLDELKNLK